MIPRALYYGMVIMLLFATQTYGQKHARKHTPYYLDMNASASLAIHDQADEMLNIQYQDRYGRNKEVLLTLFNSRHEAVGRYSLSKTFGLNHFQVNMGDAFSAWKEGDIYTCALADEAGKAYSALLRKRVPETQALVVDILVNPITLTCDALEGNLVDFYASPEGGKAPYTVNWYIMDNARAAFLYQPREERIERPGNTVIVRIDKNPDYYVMVLVKDACGKEEKKMVHLMCGEKKKKINTVFVEPIRQLPAAQKSN